jgi:Fic family protein
MQPPLWPEVPALVRDWVTHARKAGKVDDARLIERLAELHARLEQIHPFLDGNGRTGRLILNLILVRLGYPPAIIYKGDRARYLAGLRPQTAATRARSASSLLARSSTTSTSSWCQRSPGRHASFHFLPSRPRNCRRTHSAWRRRAVG